MKNYSRAGFLLFFVLISIRFIDAQVSAAESEQCHDEFAKMTVAQQVADSAAIADVGRRITTLIRAANFLWPYDEEPARGHFTTAYKLAFDNFREKGFESIRGEGRRAGLSQSLPDYRFDVVRAIAKWDSKWARTLTEELIEEFEKDVRERRPWERTREFDEVLRIAQDLAVTDPDLSWFLYRRIMRYPLDRHWFFALYGLSFRRPDMAEALYLELLMAYRGAPPRDLLYLSGYPFGDDRPLGPDRYQVNQSLPDGFTPNPDLQRRFLEVYFDRIALYAANPEERMAPVELGRLPEAAYMVAVLRDIEPMIIRDMPFLLPRYAAARSQALSLMTEDAHKQLADREEQNRQNSMSFEERLAAIEEAFEKGTLTDWMIVSLMFWGGRELTEEQFKRAEPWLARIKDEEGQKEAYDYFWFVRAERAIKDKRFRDAETFAAKVAEIEHRTVLHFNLADKQLEGFSDRAAALQTLGAVGIATSKLDNSLTRAKLHLGLAFKYINLNSAFAMDELREAVEVINRLENPNLFSTSVVKHIKVGNNSFFTVYTVPGYNLENTFREVSKLEFSISLSNAKAINDNASRTIAVLAVAGHCIDVPRDRKPLDGAEDQ